MFSGLSTKPFSTFRSGLGMDQVPHAPLVAWYQSQLYIRYIDVASFALFVYDYCITFDLEVNYIWFSRWTWIKGLFLFSRYITFLTGIGLYRDFAFGISAELCSTLFNVDAWLFLVGLGTAELILTFRTYAVWKMKRSLIIGMTIFSTLLYGSGIVAMQLFLRDLRSASWSTVGLPGCANVNGNNLLSITWVFLLAYDLVNLVLMLISGYSTFRAQNSIHTPLVLLIYQQGILYYLVLFGLSLLNVILIFKLPAQYVGLLSTLERILHSILTSRVVLCTREQGDPDKAMEHRARSALHFRTTTSTSESGE